jgi:hypothetical protein
MSLEEFYRICDNIMPDERGCKIWPFLKGRRDGRALVNINHKRNNASRIVLVKKLNRSINPGYFALHTCDNPSCIDSDHIYEGTQQQNMDDAKARKRLPSGNNHWTKIYPEKKITGSKHWSKIHPEKIVRGDKHYYNIHPELRVKGEQQGNSKLTESDVREIRFLYAADVYNQYELARIYHVLQPAIQSVICRRRWKHVE